MSVSRWFKNFWESVAVAREAEARRRTKHFYDSRKGIEKTYKREIKSVKNVPGYGAI